MKTIYVAHSKSFDFKNDLYIPLKKSKMSEKFNLVFPHEKSDVPFDSKKVLQQENVILIAEVTYPATGLGIEIGWANMLNVPIIAIHKENTKVSSSVLLLANKVIDYKNNTDLVKTIEQYFLDNF